MDLVLEETKEEMMDMIDLGSTYFMLYYFFLSKSICVLYKFIES